MYFVNLEMSKYALFRNFLVYMSKLNNINAQKKDKQVFSTAFERCVCVPFFFLNFLNTILSLVTVYFDLDAVKILFLSLRRNIYWQYRKLLFYCSYSKPTLKGTMWCVIDSSDHSLLVSCESMWEVGTATSQWEWSFLGADWVRAMAISIKIAARFVVEFGHKYRERYFKTILFNFEGR